MIVTTNPLQVFYINGDSWLSHFTNRVACSDHPLFKNIFVINHSVPGCSNMSIISRTKTALSELKKYNIKPWVCIGLSEVGRDFKNECKLAYPQENLTLYLESILKAQMNMLKHILVEHQHYICSAWTSNPVGRESLIDFIGEDLSKYKSVYTVGNGPYTSIEYHRKILKISKESFVAAVENKQMFEQALLGNPYISDTLHLDKSTSNEIYEKFFNHVLSTLGANNDN